MNQDEFLAHIAELLETASIPYMVVGSVGSSYHGQSRSTNDIDVVIDPTAAQLDHFLSLIGSACYFSSDAAREALRFRSMFNIIDLGGGSKIDLIVRKDRPFSVEEFGRRVPGNLSGRVFPFASVEDTILSKLEWNRMSASERQVRDALSVATIQWKNLDLDYLRKWADPLGIRESLEEVLRLASEAAGT